jgi:nitroreductase/NAD-dependent dihydropyrimidine dehydrogenase PreA subunit
MLIPFSIDQERCIQCGECAADCPSGIIVLEDYPTLKDPETCIRCQHCLAVCPTGALSILGVDPDKSALLDGRLPSPEQMATLIKGRRSVRRYLPEELAPELIDELVNIACHAPTGCNAQDVRFTVVRTRAALDKLRLEMLAGLEELEKSGRLPEDLVGQFMGWTLKSWREEGKEVMFRGAPHLLVATAPKEAPCPHQDTYIALATFELMAAAKGVGAVWDGIFMMALALMPDFSQRLGIPLDHVVGFAMAFGKPAVRYARTVQRGPAQVHYLD